MKQNIHKANKTSRLNKYKQEKKQANKNQMKQANTWKQTNETNKVKNTYKQANKKATKQHKEKQKQRHTYKREGNQSAYLFRALALIGKASGWRIDQLTFMIADNSKAMHMQDS